LNLIHLGLLEPIYPFKIDSKTDLFKELKEYNLKEAEKIGEIGCGVGTFGLLLNQFEPNINLYLNELDQPFLSYIKLAVDENEKFYTS
jgi:16S rRNA G1207 methylase RsmC